MICCKIFILLVLIEKYYFPSASVEVNSKQLSVETNLFRTDNHSVESRKFKQLKVNRKEKSGSEKQSIHIYMKIIKHTLLKRNITCILDIH